MSLTQIIGLSVGGAVAVACGLIIWLAYRKGAKDRETEIMRRDAEACAERNLRVEEEARRTHEAVESVGNDTPTARGNRLLSGARDWRDPKGGAASDS